MYFEILPPSNSINHGAERFIDLLEGQAAIRKGSVILCIQQRQYGRSINPDAEYVSGKYLCITVYGTVTVLEDKDFEEEEYGRMLPGDTELKIKLRY